MHDTSQTARKCCPRVMQEAVFFAVCVGLLVLAACAGPQTTTPHKVGQAEAIQIASQLAVGMTEDDATKFLERNGLRSGGRIGSSQGWYSFFPLANGVSLGLNIRPKEPKPDAGWANGLLQAAFLQSNGVIFSSITLTNTP